jgi:hypothetical protein
MGTAVGIRATSEMEYGNSHSGAEFDIFFMVGALFEINSGDYFHLIVFRVLCLIEGRCSIVQIPLIFVKQCKRRFGHGG